MNDRREPKLNFIWMRHQVLSCWRLHTSLADVQLQLQSQHHRKVRTFCTCNHDHGFEIRRVVLSLCNFNLIVDNHQHHTLQSEPSQLKQLVHYFPPESVFLVSVQFSSVQFSCVAEGSPPVLFPLPFSSNSSSNNSLTLTLRFQKRIALHLFTSNSR
jgi:hypothetical protein